jgi:thioredoxin
MSHQLPIQEILSNLRTVAVVGLSKNQEKASYQVAEYLQKAGFNIVPINPSADKILSEKSYKSLQEIPNERAQTVEIVDIFRPSEEALAIVEYAVELKRRHGRLSVVWMQLGIVNEVAAQKARKEGITVIMDKCMMREHGRLFGEKEDVELKRIKERKIKEMLQNAEKPTSVPIKVTDADFEANIKKHKVILVDCWADWCGPCRMMSPIIDELAKEYAGEVVFAKLNVDENPRTPQHFNISGIPTLLIFKDGKLVDRLVGATPKLLLENRVKKFL